MHAGVKRDAFQQCQARSHLTTSSFNPPQHTCASSRPCDRQCKKLGKLRKVVNIATVAPTG
eukprot:4406361-Amphidinium_carterae.4